MKPYNQSALLEASRQVHMMLLREGSNWGMKACEEMGLVFMTAYLKALPTGAPTPAEVKALYAAAHAATTFLADMQAAPTINYVRVLRKLNKALKPFDRRAGGDKAP